MSGPADARRGVGPGRLDPTVRALLRAFLAPAVADRYASALQPIAVADRDAAVAGAVSTLRAHFFVLPEEIAVQLLLDTLWSAEDVATLLGMSVAAVRQAAEDQALTDVPRIQATPPPDVDADEVELVEALLAQVPTTRRRASTTLPDEELPDVELTTFLPAHVGLPSLEERFAAADRRQRQVVFGTIAAIVVLVALTVNATRPGTPVTADDDVVIDIADDADDPPADDATDPGDEDPEEVASPSLPRGDVPLGPATVAEARFVATVDPRTGEPGPALTTIAPDGEARLWVRMAQLPATDVLVELSFVDPTGARTVRPVLITGRVPLLSVRLPAELGRTPGRFAAIVEVEGEEGLERTVVELEVVAPEG